MLMVTSILIFHKKALINNRKNEIKLDQLVIIPEVILLDTV